MDVLWHLRFGAAKISLLNRTGPFRDHDLLLQEEGHKPPFLSLGFTPAYFARSADRWFHKMIRGSRFWMPAPSALYPVVVLDTTTPNPKSFRSLLRQALGVSVASSSSNV
jgi:hypothetical protein